MISRRDFLQAGVAAAAIFGAGNFPVLAARQALTQNQLLDFKTTGNVTIIHFTDCHAQVKPVWFREPSVNIGVGAQKGLLPHITGQDLLNALNYESGTPQAYAFTSEDFVSLARSYGKMGGLDRVSTIVKSIRAERLMHCSLMVVIRGTGP